MKKALITGATGLLGSHLAFLLIQSGYTVKACIRSEAAKNQLLRTFSYYFSEPLKLFNAIEQVSYSLDDVSSIEDALQDVDVIFHCAAIVSFDKRDRDELYKTNIEGTANLVNAALHMNTSYLLHVSSIAALGRHYDPSIPVDESTSWKPSPENSYYSISKAGAEREVWRGFEEGLKGCVINPSIITGASDWSKGSSKMFTKVWEGLKYYTEGRSGFVDVRDVAEIMMKLYEKNITGKRFVINSENLSYKQFFELISNQLNKPAPSIKAGPLLSYIAWLADSIRTRLTGGKALITKETSKSAHRKASFDNKEIIRILGHKFIPIEDSVKHTAKLFLYDHNQLKA